MTDYPLNVTMCLWKQNGATGQNYQTPLRGDAWREQKESHSFPVLNKVESVLPVKLQWFKETSSAVEVQASINRCSVRTVGTKNTMLTCSKKTWRLISKDTPVVCQPTWLGVAQKRPIIILCAIIVGVLQEWQLDLFTFLSSHFHCYRL